MKREERRREKEKEEDFERKKKNFFHLKKAGESNGKKRRRQEKLPNKALAFHQGEKRINLFREKRNAEKKNAPTSATEGLKALLASFVVELSRFVVIITWLKWNKNEVEEVLVIVSSLFFLI